MPNDYSAFNQVFGGGSPGPRAQLRLKAGEGRRGIQQDLYSRGMEMRRSALKDAEKAQKKAQKYAMFSQLMGMGGQAAGAMMPAASPPPLYDFGSGLGIPSPYDFGGGLG